MLTLYEAQLSGIGAPTNDPTQQWASLSLGFREGDCGPILRAVLNMVVPKRPDATMIELQETARSSAIDILEVSLQTLREFSVAELEAQADRAQEL